MICSQLGHTVGQVCGSPSCEFWQPASQNRDKPISSCGHREQSWSIKGHELEGYSSRNELKLPFIHELRSIIGARKTLVHKCLHIIRHMRTLTVFSHLVVLFSLFGISCQFGVVRQYRMRAGNLIEPQFWRAPLIYAVLLRGPTRSYD